MLFLLVFALVVIFIQTIAFLLPGKLANTVELTLVISGAFFLFYYLTMTEAIISISILSIVYVNFNLLLSKENQKIRKAILPTLQSIEFEKIELRRQKQRLWHDLFLASMLAGIFVSILIFAKENIGPAKLLIVFGLIYLIENMVRRVIYYRTVTFYYNQKKQELYVVTLLDVKRFPLSDLKEFHQESRPDILKLFPLFQLFSDREDYTTAETITFKLTFPNQIVYFNPEDIEKYQEILQTHTAMTLTEEPRKVLPFWHRTVLKRLIIKFYYAITIQGIAAYTATIILFAYLELPASFIIIFILIWWLLNLYFSDVLILKTVDAEEVKDAAILNRLETLLEQANLKGIGLYVTDSTVYNGLAIGMNISRGKIILTKATLELPIIVMEGILAHEIIHLKKRDVLWQQIAKMTVLAILGFLFYINYEQLKMLAENTWVIFLLVYFLMFIIPMITAFISQWHEVRADYLAETLLAGGKKQMKESLKTLGLKQDEATNKETDYQLKEEKKAISSIEREGWFLRWIEFYFLNHPPLYFRLELLNSEKNYVQTIFYWITAHISEFLPKKVRKGV